MEVRLRVWIEENGKVIFGDGRAMIFRKAVEKGSLWGAAGALEMSYKALWSKIKTTEKRTGIKFIKTSRGRKGGTVITEEGIRFLERYEAFRAKLQEKAEELFREYFPEGLS
ncbi:MAG: winged helix-turn-helix domain-containing protein [Thermodesulforhabdaceae bacterium]